MAHTPALDLFRDLVCRPAEQVDLASAALLIALDEYPGLNVSDYLKRIDALAEQT